MRHRPLQGKREGRGTVRFYDLEMDRRTREHHALQHDLRLASAATSSSCIISRRRDGRRDQSASRH